MPSGGGHLPSGKPGVERMCSMLDAHAARSASLCCGPNGSRRNSLVASEVGGSKPTGTNSSEAMTRTVSGSELPLISLCCEAMSRIRSFDHVGITVADLDAVSAFFVELGLAIEGRTF